MLRDGSIVHAELRIKIATLETECKRLERVVAGLSPDPMGIRAQGIRLLFGLLEKGIIVIVAMAYYGSKMGWGA